MHRYRAEIDKIEELTLLLIYLTSWKEEVIKGEFLRNIFLFRIKPEV